MVEKRKRSEICGYFSKLNDRRKVCNQCSRQFFEKSSTKTLKNHLLRSHPGTLQIIDTEEEQASTICK